MIKHYQKLIMCVFKPVRLLKLFILQAYLSKTFDHVNVRS